MASWVGTRPAKQKRGRIGRYNEREGERERHVEICTGYSDAACTLTRPSVEPAAAHELAHEGVEPH